MSVPFNDEVYDQNRTDLDGLPLDSLRRFESLAETPAQQAALRDAIEEAERRG